MSWSTPTSVATGELCTAAFWNAQVKGNMDHLSRSLLVPEHQSGQVYRATLSQSASGGNPVAGRIYAAAFIVPAEGGYNSFSMSGITSPTGTMRYGIYLDDGGLPGALAYDSGDVTVTATSPDAISPAETLTPGLYWIAVTFSSATPSSNRRTAGEIFLPAGQGSVYNDQAYGALPDPFGVPDGNINNFPDWLIEKA